MLLLPGTCLMVNCLLKKAQAVAQMTPIIPIATMAPALVSTILLPLRDMSNGEIVGDILDRSPGFEKRDPLPQGSSCGTNDPNNPNCHHGSRSGKY
jgi:hypothetical protein